jgi:hypothetical protein
MGNERNKTFTSYATAQPPEDFSGRKIRSNQVDVVFEPDEFDWNDEVHLDSIPGRTAKHCSRRVEAKGAQLDQMDLDG